MQDIQLDDQQYFKALTEASIVSKSNIDGIVTYVNDNFCSVTGYSREEIIGRSHNLFRHPHNPDSLYKELWETILSGKIWRGRMVNLNKDGSSFIAETTIIPLVDHNGRIKEFMAIRNDITQMVALKRMIFAREQDIVKNKKIEEAKESFLLIFTHELKTPLNAIINFTKYIIKQFDKDVELDQGKVKSLLGSVLSNASDMLDNITMILEVSKITSHKLTYHFSLFSLNQLLNQSMKKYESLIYEKNISLQLRAERELWVYSDEQRVKQIFSNILSNAIKYGKDQITVTLDQAGSTTRLVIEDNGPGIADKEAVFDLYHQEDENLTTRVSQGTGIGLYFTKLVCEDLHIRYELEDGERHTGTRFSLYFSDAHKKPKQGNP